MGCQPVIAIIIVILTAILIPVLVGECVDWLPWAGTRLIRLAANRLPVKHRTRYEEEWQGEFNALPGGKLTKLLFGLRIYAGARATGAVCQAEDNMDLAARVLALAQLTADQAIADARREADQTLLRARQEADIVLTMAREQAMEIVQAARTLAQTDPEPSRRPAPASRSAAPPGSRSQSALFARFRHAAQRLSRLWLSGVMPHYL
jgi:hypothetical protein